MKRTTLIVATGALALVSVAAFAQMPGMSQDTMAPVQDRGGMHDMMMQRHGGMHAMMQNHDGAGMTQGRGGHAGRQGLKGDSGPASLAFNGVNAKMHAAMDVAYTGNADVDFVQGMIPHHQGAVDMAKIVLAFGKDPELKKLAEAIVKAQMDEIAFMQEWLKKSDQR